MTAAALVAQLGAADGPQRSQALAALVRLGPAATPLLWPLLAAPADPRRAAAAQALAEIANPTDAEAFAAALADAEPAVRARAAQGLARLGDPRATAALVLTLDDLPDLLHHPATLATQLLEARGPAVLPQVLPLLDAPALGTRQRAWLVVHGVLARQPGAGPWATLGEGLRGYAPDAAPGMRAAAARHGADWLKANATP